MPLRTYKATIGPKLRKEIAAAFLVEALPDLANGLPDIRNSDHLSALIGISPGVVRGILRNKRRHYRTFSLRKRSGGERIIDAPRTFLKVTQWWIYDVLLRNQDPGEHIFGFVPNRNFVGNAIYHQGSQHILNVDIENFFPSLRKADAYGVFTEVGISADGADVLAELCTYNDQLPQGAPTSPMIANLALRQMDDQLRQIAERNGLRFSRYADDITYSSPNKIPEEILASVSHVVSARGLSLNVDKTKFMGPGARREVTGLVVTPAVAIPRKTRKLIRAMRHRYETRPDLRGELKDKLQGYLGLVISVDGWDAASAQAIRNLIDPAAP